MIRIIINFYKREIFNHKKPKYEEYEFVRKKCKSNIKKS